MNKLNNKKYRWLILSYRLVINKQKKLVDDIVSVVLVILLVFVAFAVTL